MFDVYRTRCVKPRDSGALVAKRRTTYGYFNLLTSDGAIIVVKFETYDVRAVLLLTKAKTVVTNTWSEHCDME